MLRLMDIASQMSLKHYMTDWRTVQSQIRLTDAVVAKALRLYFVAHISQWVFQCCFKQDMYIEVFKKKQWRNYCLCEGHLKKLC